MKNTLSLFIARNRWIRRLGISTPDIGYVRWRSWPFFVYLKDWSGPSYHILRWGVDSYENHCYQTIRKFCSEQSVFFDIGANVGIFSSRICREILGIRVYAFEPEPNAYACLKKNIEINLLSNVQAYNCAISSYNGEAVLYSDKINAGGHSLEARAIIEDGSIISLQKSVSLISLDHFCSVEKLDRVDVIKIDVQRHESHVLEGAQTILRNYRPAVLIECFISELIDPSQPLTKYFLALDNYKVVDPVSEKIFSISEISDFIKGLNPEEYRDLFFVPEESVFLLNLEK